MPLQTQIVQDDNGHEAEQAFIAHRRGLNEQVDGLAYMQAHPDEVAAYIQGNPPPGLSMAKATAVEGKSPALQQPMIDPTFVAPDVLGGPAAIAANIGSQAAMGLGGEAAGKAGAGPGIQAAAGIAAGALAGHLVGSAGGALSKGAAEGAAAPAELPVTPQAELSAGGAGAAKPIPLTEAQATTGQAAGQPIPLTREQASYIPISGGVATTPQQAAQQFAMKHAATMKAMKVGEGVATEAGHPELATQVPESETMAAGKAQGLTMQQLRNRPIQPPDIAAQTAALTQTVGDEVRSLQGDAKRLIKRQAAGEDVTAEKDAWVNRFSAVAPQAARVGAQRSGVGRAMQILDPLKPENQQINAVNRIALDVKDGQTPDELMQAFAKGTSAKQIAIDMGKASQIVDQGGSLRGAVSQYFTNALLSRGFGARTGLKKGVGDLYSMAMAIPERAIAARLNLIPGYQGTVKPGEASILAANALNGKVYGEQRAWAEALSNMGKTWANKGRSALDEQIGQETGAAMDIGHYGGGFTSKGTRFENTRMGKGIDLVGSVVGIPSRGIGSMTDGPKTIHYRSELHATAYRDAVNEASTQGLEGAQAGQFIAQRAQDLASNPSADRMINARKYADAGVYAAPLGPIGQGFNKQVLDRLPLGLGRLAFPFRQVPANLYKYAVARTPIGLLTRDFWHAMRGGPSEARDLAIAKMTLGTVMNTMLAEAVANYLITGGGPKDPKLRDDWIHAGNTPYSIRIGRYHVPYGWAEPFAFPLGILADAHELFHEAPHGDWHALANAMVLALGRNFSRQSMVMTLVNLSNMAGEWMHGGGSEAPNVSKFAGEELSGLIPGLLQGEAEREDPVWHETKGLVDTFKSKTPGYSSTVPPHLDMDGKPVPRPPGFFANEVWPFALGQENHDPLAQELYKTGAHVPRAPAIIPGSGGHAQRFGELPSDPDVGVDLSPQQQARWTELRAQMKDSRGGTMRDAMTRTMAEPRYQNLATVDKAHTLESIAKGYGHAASAQLLTEDTALQARYEARQKYKALAHQPSPETLGMNE